MKINARFSAIAVSVAVLSSAATLAANAAIYTINENFNAATVGSLAQPLFAAAPVSVTYGFRVSEFAPWEADTSFPLNVELNDGNKVLGDGFGPILFALQPEVTFSAFSIDVVTTGSPFATTTAVGYFQSLTGSSLGTFTFDQTIVQSLTLSLPAGTGAVILPSESQYDNVAFTASGTVVPEMGSLPLAFGGLITLVGAVLARRRK